MPSMFASDAVGVTSDGWTCAVVLSPYNRDIASIVPIIDLERCREGTD